MIENINKKSDSEFNKYVETNVEDIFESEFDAFCNEIKPLDLGNLDNVKYVAQSLYPFIQLANLYEIDMPIKVEGFTWKQIAEELQERSKNGDYSHLVPILKAVQSRMRIF